MTTKQKQRSFTKDVHCLYKKIDSMSGGQARVVDCESSALLIEIAPNDGHYKGGKWKFKINGDDRYPSLPPIVRCETDIYHPNIDIIEEEEEEEDVSGSNICVSLLDDGEWNESFTLEDCIQAILFLFYNPNWSDALSPMFSCEMTEDEFAKNVAVSLQGGHVDGYDFERNYGYIEEKCNDAEEQLVNEKNKLNIEKMEEMVLERIDSIIDVDSPETEVQGQTTLENNYSQEETTPGLQTEHVEQYNDDNDESVKFITSLLDELIHGVTETADVPHNSTASDRVNSTVFKRSTSQVEQSKQEDGDDVVIPVGEDFSSKAVADIVISPDEKVDIINKVDLESMTVNHENQNPLEKCPQTQDNSDRTLFVFDNLIPCCEILPVLNACMCEKLFDIR